MSNGGALDGGVPTSPVKLKKTPMSHVSIAKEWPCPLSILGKGPDACHYNSKASCRVTNPSCCMSNLRNGHVAMSNLVVQTHNGGATDYRADARLSHLTIGDPEIWQED